MRSAADDPVFVRISRLGIVVSAVIALLGRSAAEPPSVTVTMIGDNEKYEIPIPKEQMGKFVNLGAESKRLLSVEWNPVRRDKPNEINVSGTIRIKRKDAAVPLSWQGVRVVMARTPGQSPDWRKGINYKTAVWANCVLREDGQFKVQMGCSSIQRSIEVKAKFQVALVVASIEDGKLVWETRQPILDQSLSSVTVEGQERLSRDLGMINAVGSPLGWEHDPISLIRAVNHLRSVGKKKSIEAMREFIEKANLSGPIHRIPESLDTSDQQNLRLLIPLLFPTDDTGKPPPAWVVGRSTSEYYITVVDDIPFHNVRFSGGAGDARFGCESLVDWAESHGSIRARSLRPGNNPLEAAN